MSSGKNASRIKSHSSQIARYLGDDVWPLIASGFGLSNASFEIKNPQLKNKRISVNGATQVPVDVTNTGKRAGTETVQLSRICKSRF
jgi:beta-glucosidase